MSAPTRKEMIDHLREHYGLTINEVMQFLNLPLHPLTLRDDFAKAALQGLIAGCFSGSNSGFTVEGNVVAAYEYADEMLDRRLK